MTYIIIVIFYFQAQDPLLNSLDIDYEYILRQCRLYKRRRAAVRALLLLDCTIEAVDEALVLDLAEAKALVLQQQQLGADSDLLRQLWMEIAKVVIERESDMAVPIALIKESDGALTIDVSTCRFILSTGGWRALMCTLHDHCILIYHLHSILGLAAAPAELHGDRAFPGGDLHDAAGLRGQHPVPQEPDARAGRLR